MREVELPKMKCSVCRVLFKPSDAVFMDEMYFFAHQRCYSLETNFPIKDLGSYRSVIIDNDLQVKNVE